MTNVDNHHEADDHPTPWDLVEYKLQFEVDETRASIIKRALWLAERLSKLADGLDGDPNYVFNTVGELQGNGVELDTWCARLGLARDTLKVFKQAKAAAQGDA
jgi:hypothetical protein